MKVARDPAFKPASRGHQFFQALGNIGFAAARLHDFVGANAKGSQGINNFAELVRAGSGYDSSRITIAVDFKSFKELRAKEIAKTDIFHCEKFRRVFY